jgi:site-specific DNA-cytosine methylase
MADVKRPQKRRRVMCRPASRQQPRVVEPGASTITNAWKTQRVDGPALPDWAGHYVGLLFPCFEALKYKMGPGPKTLSCWCDCGGMGTESLAMATIADVIRDRAQLDLSINVECFCDTNAHCRTFAGANIKPKHIAHDIYARDFQAGTYFCDVHQQEHTWPTRTDIYVCCFPCGPWSVRGKRLGFNDACGQVVWQAIHTVKALKPAMWFMENVLAIDHNVGGGESALGNIQEKMASELPEMHMMVLRHIDPCHCGFPTRRDRIGLVGVRRDLVPREALTHAFSAVLAAPMQLSCDYRTFVGRTTAIDLARVGERPTPEERLQMLQSPCTCAFDPRVQCSTHPCRCNHCKSGNVGRCEWRDKHADYIKKNYATDVMLYKDIIDLAATLLPYTAVVEKQGVALPQSQRERNMINILAAHLSLRPLMLTNAIMDKEHTITRAAFRVDGLMPTLVVNSSMFSFRDADTLGTAEVAKLMGHDIGNLDLTGISERQFRHMLGMSLHKSVAGLLVIGLLAALGGPL